MHFGYRVDFGQLVDQKSTYVKRTFSDGMDVDHNAFEPNEICQSGTRNLHKHNQATEYSTKQPIVTS